MSILADIFFKVELPFKSTSGLDSQVCLGHTRCHCLASNNGPNQDSNEYQDLCFESQEWDLTSLVTQQCRITVIDSSELDHFDNIHFMSYKPTAEQLGRLDWNNNIVVLVQSYWLDLMCELYHAKVD